jgi:alanine-glyoxylate transaminase/serine-glyoxylate transaminase/serine-pyruvate transaminase
MDLARPDQVLLLGPGPSPVPEPVLQAMSWSTLGHLDPQFLTYMNATMELLREVFQTQNRLTLPISGTGSAGMEAALVNLLEPGDTAVIGVNGVFGARMVDAAGRLGARVVEVSADWGRPLDPNAFERALTAHPEAKLVAFVHAETSTGVLQPPEEITAAAHARGALVLVDTVTSLGGMPVCVDERRFDLAFSGSQKCLSCPPGLAPLTINEAGLEVVRTRKTRVQSWYLDLSMLAQYWGTERVYHHTAPINMAYALYMALKLIADEGLEARFRRHRTNSRALIAGLAEYGLELVPPVEHALPSLVVVHIPEGVSDGAVRARLRNVHRIEIGGGLGPFKGRVWRIGLMGEGSRRQNVERLLEALAEALNHTGYACSARQALAAAAAAYAAES